MAKQNLRIPQLAKLRQFKKGDDIGQFLSTQFRQIVRAIEQSYVNQDVSTSDLLGQKPSVQYSDGYDNGSWTGTALLIGPFSMNVSVSSADSVITVGLCQDNQQSTFLANAGEIYCATGYLQIYCERTNILTGETEIVISYTVNSPSSNGIPASSLFTIDKPGIGEFNYSFYGTASATADIRYCKMYIRTN